jgi:hypothetical protein
MPKCQWLKCVMLSQQEMKILELMHDLKHFMPSICFNRLTFAVIPLSDLGFSTQFVDFLYSLLLKPICLSLFEHQTISFVTYCAM